MPPVIMSVMLLASVIILTFLVQDCSASELFKEHLFYFNIKYKTVIWFSLALQMCIWLLLERISFSLLYVMFSIFFGTREISCQTQTDWQNYFFYLFLFCRTLRKPPDWDRVGGRLSWVYHAHCLCESRRRAGESVLIVCISSSLSSPVRTLVRAGLKVDAVLVSRSKTSPSASPSFEGC